MSQSVLLEIIDNKQDLSLKPEIKLRLETYNNAKISKETLKEKQLNAENKRMMTKNQKIQKLMNYKEKVNKVRNISKENYNQKRNLLLSKQNNKDIMSKSNRENQINKIISKANSTNKRVNLIQNFKKSPELTEVLSQQKNLLLQLKTEETRKPELLEKLNENRLKATQLFKAMKN